MRSVRNIPLSAFGCLAAAVIVLFIADIAAAAQTKYDRLEQLFLEGKYQNVVSDAQGLIRSGYGRKDEIYYLKGLSELKLKKFGDARESFGYITARSQRTQMTFDAYLGIGDSYMLAGQPNDAIGAYNRVADEFPNDKNLPVVYSRLAGCYDALGLKDKADHYQNMANRAAPMSFEAKGSAVEAPPPRPALKQAARAPVTNIVPQRSETPRPASPAAYDSPQAENVDVILATGRSFSVQVGSFKNRNNSEKLARRLVSQGYEARVEIPVNQLDKLYRVKVGTLGSEAEAERLAARLRSAGYNTKICDGEACR